MKKQSYASAAKVVMNKYKLRLGDKFDKSDPLALAAMNAELTALQVEQEATREAELGAAPQFAKGGKLPMYEGPGPLSQQLNPTFLPGMGYQQGVAPTLNALNPPTNFATGMNFNTGEGYMDSSLQMPDASLTGSTESASAGNDPFKSRVPWIGAAAGLVGGLMSNRKLDLPSYDYEEYKPEKVQANLVDYSRGREQTMRERDQAQAMITRNARGTGSQAGLMENILAGATGTQRAAGTAFNQSIEQEGNVNAQIKNEASARNAQLGMQAGQMNMRNKLYANQLDRENVLFNDQRRQNRIGAVTGAVTGYSKDLLAANQYDQMINMMAPDNYQLTQGPDSPFKRLFQISQDQRISFRNTGDKATNG